MQKSGVHIVEPAQARQRLAEATDETTYNNTDEEEDEEPEVFAPVPRLRSGFSTASSAGVWETWPVRAPPDCGDGSLEEELAAAEELVVDEDLVPLAGEPSTVVEPDELAELQPKRSRVR